MSNTVLVVQKSNYDQKIWRQILESQGLTAITESPQANFRDFIRHSSLSSETFPQLMILDMSIENLNPYEFCRWVQENYPSVKIILTNRDRKTISDIERRWATNQGAFELLPRFDEDNLTASLTNTIKLIWGALGKKDVQEEALVPIVEDLRQELFPFPGDRTLLQETSASQPSEEEKQLVVATQAENSRPKTRGYKLKPKVKRFRGLPY